MLAIVDQIPALAPAAAVDPLLFQINVCKSKLMEGILLL
jgi:hypothetical protein